MVESLVEGVAGELPAVLEEEAGKEVAASTSPEGEVEDPILVVEEEIGTFRGVVDEVIPCRWSGTRSTLNKRATSFGLCAQLRNRSCCSRNNQWSHRSEL